MARVEEGDKRDLWGGLGAYCVEWKHVTLTGQYVVLVAYFMFP